MENLPTDCLLKIFYKFDLRKRVALETVCRRWHRILQSIHAYSDITSLEVIEFLRSMPAMHYTQNSEKLENILLEAIKHCGPFIQNIDYGGRWLTLRQPIIDKITRYCCRLKHINFGCTIIDADISALLDNLQNQLEYFSIEESSWSDKENEKKEIDWIDDNVDINPYKIKTNLCQCPTVELDLSGASNIYGIVLAEFLKQHKSTLKELNICPFPTLAKDNEVDKMNFDLNKMNVTQTIINAISTLKEMRMLSVGYIAEIPQHCSMRRFCELTNLRFLHMQECKCLDTTSLRMMTANMQHLRTLHIIKCTNVENYLCLSNIKRIRELEIRHAPALENDSLSKVFQNGKGLKRLRLETCPNITNTAIIELTKNCTKIKELELSKCDGIADNIFSNSNEWDGLQSLQTISLNGTTSITNKAMAELSNMALIESLQELDISHNKNIDNKTIEQLHEAILMRTHGKKRKPTTIYVFQTGVSVNMQAKVHPEIELIS